MFASQPSSYCTDAQISLSTLPLVFPEEELIAFRAQRAESSGAPNKPLHPPLVCAPTVTGKLWTGHVTQKHMGKKSGAAVFGEMKLVTVLEFVIAEHRVIRHLATPPEQTYCRIIQAHGPCSVELEQPNVRPRVHFNVN